MSKSRKSKKSHPDRTPSAKDRLDKTFYFKELEKHSILVIMEIDQNFIEVRCGIYFVADALQPVAISDLGLEVLDIGFLDPELLGFLVHNSIHLAVSIQSRLWLSGEAPDGFLS